MKLRFPTRRTRNLPGTVASSSETGRPRSPTAIRRFLLWMGPALMVSMAYMDPGNYGTDLAAGAGYKYDLLWAVWLASGMAMLLQYLSGKLGIASGYSLAELVRRSLEKKRYVLPYWLAAEAAIAATDLAEYLGTVLGLNLLFGVPLLYAALLGALDVIFLLAVVGRRFRLIEQYFVVLIGILATGILYNILVIGPDLTQIAYHSVLPLASDSTALLIVVGVIGATVMPHAIFVHSWLSKNKMDLLGKRVDTGVKSFSSSTSVLEESRHPYSTEEKHRIRKLHRNETLLALTIAGIVNAGILLVAIPLYPNQSLTVSEFVVGIGAAYGPAIGVIFVLTLLASGLSSSALGTIAGQVVMEGLIGRRLNVWARRIVTRGVNVFPTTVAILLGLDPLSLLVYSQVILSLMIPLPMIPLVYYTSKSSVMGELVNRRSTVGLAILTVALIIGFNSYLIVTLI